MASKYQSLSDFLAMAPGTEWVATFNEIEAILGFCLPESARQYQAWWSNNLRSQSASWLSVGWRTRDLDLKNECITFVYSENKPLAVGSVAAFVKSEGLTIAQAKAGLAETFGVDPSQIDIIIKG